MVIEAGGKSLKNAITADAKEDNPSNPYWPYVISKVGRLTLERAGSYNLSLKTAAMQPGQKYGLTLVSVRLVPVKL